MLPQLQMQEQDYPEFSLGQQKQRERSSSSAALFNKVFHAYAFDPPRSFPDPFQVLEDPAQIVFAFALDGNNNRGQVCRAA